MDGPLGAAPEGPAVAGEQPEHPRDISPLVLLALLSLPLAVRLIRVVRERTDGPSLNQALAQTGMLLALFSLLLSIGLVAS